MNDAQFMINNGMSECTETLAFPNANNEDMYFYIKKW